MNEILEHWLSLPRIEITEREWQTARWRWEFLRLNPDYQRDYQKEGRPGPLPTANLWGLNEWLNPDLPFEDLYEETRQELKGTDFEDSEDTARFLTIERLGSYFSQGINAIFLYGDSEGNPLKSSIITFQVNTDLPDSVLVEGFKRWLELLRPKIRGQRPSWNRDKMPEYLEVARLYYKENKSAKEIVEIVFPGPDPYSDDETVSDGGEPERTVYRHLEAAKDLVERGYQRLY